MNLSTDYVMIRVVKSNINSGVLTETEFKSFLSRFWHNMEIYFPGTTDEDVIIQPRSTNRSKDFDRISFTVSGNTGATNDNIGGLLVQTLIEMGFGEADVYYNRTSTIGGIVDVKVPESEWES